MSLHDISYVLSHPRTLALPAFFAVATLYCLVPWFIAFAVAVRIRKWPGLAYRIFQWVRVMHPATPTMLLLIGGVLPLSHIARVPWFIPVTVRTALSSDLAWSLCGAVLVCISAIALNLAYLDQNGFVLETTGRRSISIHIHRPLNAAAIRAFDVWLDSTLSWCAMHGVTEVRMASHHLCNERRRAWLLTLLTKHRSVATVRTARARPMVPPTTIKFWWRFCRWPRGIGLVRAVWKVAGEWLIRRKVALIIRLRPPNGADSRI